MLALKVHKRKFSCHKLLFDRWTTILYFLGFYNVSNQQLTELFLTISFLVNVLLLNLNSTLLIKKTLSKIYISTKKICSHTFYKK